MFKLLYLNDEELHPNLTTCPMENLIFENPGYSSNCGAQWFSTKGHYIDFSVFGLILNEIKDVPEPQGNEIYEIIFNAEGVKYNYYDGL